MKNASNENSFLVIPLKKIIEIAKNLLDANLLGNNLVSLSHGCVPEITGSTVISPKEINKLYQFLCNLLKCFFKYS